MEDLKYAFYRLELNSRISLSGEIPLSDPFAIAILVEPDHESPLVGRNGVGCHRMNQDRCHSQHSRLRTEIKFYDLSGPDLTSVEGDVELEVAACQESSKIANRKADLISWN